MVDVPFLKFMYFVFTCMPGESYHRRFGSLLLCSWDVFRDLINSFYVLVPSGWVFNFNHYDPDVLLEGHVVHCLVKHLPTESVTICIVIL